MSREIKFRVWNNYANEWMSGATIDICNSFGVPSPTLKVKPPLVYQQFTGLIDNKGNEVYEGDILQTEKWGYAPIKFFSGSFQLSGWALKSLVSPSTPEILHGYEVVGNILENPELL